MLTGNECSQYVMFISYPLQLKLLNTIGPLPAPKAEPLGAATASEKPSWWHTTTASSRPQSLAHTVVQ